MTGLHFSCDSSKLQRQFVLVEQGGKTTLTQTVLYESYAARDVVLESPMESGVAASYDKLAELLSSFGATAEKDRASHGRNTLSGTYGPEHWRSVRGVSRRWYSAEDAATVCGGLLNRK